MVIYLIKIIIAINFLKYLKLKKKKTHSTP